MSSPQTFVQGTGGTPNTGGGGGANSANLGGGPGVVILAIPTPQYPGSAPGAVVTTPPAALGMTVLTYPGPGSYSYTA
jgi:hypothetical protein